ncbi:hypothetical protein KCU90_g152, partial [Aureobasidium melanogenum]
MIVRTSLEHERSPAAGAMVDGVLSTYKVSNHSSYQVLLKMFMMKDRDLSFVPSQDQDPSPIFASLEAAAGQQCRITFLVNRTVIVEFETAQKSLGDRSSRSTQKISAHHEVKHLEDSEDHRVPHTVGAFPIGSEVSVCSLSALLTEHICQSRCDLLISIELDTAINPESTITALLEVVSMRLSGTDDDESF